MNATFENQDIHQGKHFFTVDVEDYYHVFGYSKHSNWDSFKPRVAVGIAKILNLLDEFDSHGTFFFLGYIAQRHPSLVKEIVNRGHEIASHGMEHRPLTHMSKEEFIHDASTSQKLLQDISGRDVYGWRSPGFLITNKQNYLFDALAQCGYKYDSSLIPNRFSHQKLLPIPEHPFRIDSSSGSITEFPMSIATVMGIRAMMFGGAYLRFFPKSLIHNNAKKILSNNTLISYIHPRELDIDAPRMFNDPFNYYRNYVNLSTSEHKLRSLLSLRPSQSFASVWEK